MNNSTHDATGGAGSRETPGVIQFCLLSRTFKFSQIEINWFIIDSWIKYGF